MADLVVALPEPHPEDDEDVVWGLSTASALWARGERRDAIVWMRRAVEAADAAGQPFRASELGLYVTALEEALSADRMRLSLPEADAMRLSASDIEATVSQNGGALTPDEVTKPSIEPGAARHTPLQRQKQALDVDPFELPTIPPMPRLSPPALPPSRPPPQVPRAVDAGSGNAARSALPYPPALSHSQGSSSQPPALHPIYTTPVPQRPSSYPQPAPLSQQPQGVAFAPQQSAPAPQAPLPPLMRPQGSYEPLLPPPARVPSGSPPSVRPPSMRPSPPVPFSTSLSSTSARRSSVPPRPSSVPLSPVPPPPSTLVSPTGTRTRMGSGTNPPFVPRAAGARYTSDTPSPFAHPPSTSRAGSHPPAPPASPAAHPPSGPTSPPPLAAPLPHPAQVPATPPPPPPSITLAAQRAQDLDFEEPHLESAPTSTGKSAPRAGPSSVPSQGRSKLRPRTPILDPWSEDAEHAAPTRSARDLITVSGDAFLVARRTPAQNENGEEEDEVITSAVSLDLALKRKPAPARPPPVPPQAAPRVKPAAPAAGELPGSFIATTLVSVVAMSGGAAFPAADKLRADDEKAVEQPSEFQPIGAAMAEVVAENPAHEPPLSPVLGDTPAALETSAPERPAVQGPADHLLDRSAAPAPALARAASVPPQGEHVPPQEASALSQQASVPPPQQLDPSAAPQRDAPPRELAESASAEPASDVSVVEPASAASAPRTAKDLSGRDLEHVDAFADLPEEMHDELARAAHVDRLAENEELSGFGAALVLDGNAAVCTTIVDMPAHRAVTKTLVPSRGTLSERIPLRIVAGMGGAWVAIWDQAIIDKALRSCPWVMDELRAAADRLQALAGATLGPLGNLDEGSFGRILGRLSLRLLQPAEQLISTGNPIPGLVVVGAGSLELVAERTGQLQGAARSGDLLFAAALLAGQPAPTDVRAAPGGAVILLGEHPVLRELFESTPELVSLLAQET